MKPQLKLVNTQVSNNTSPSKIVLQKGVYIYKRKNSDLWQAYVRIKGQTPNRKSTDTDDVNEAKKFAMNLLASTQYKVDNNLPIKRRLFADVANKYIEELDRLVANGKMKSAKFAKTTLHNYFVPYFGKMSVESINRVAITQFQKWRIENSVKFEDGVRCKPSTATLNKEETALNRILEFALDEGFISQKPTIKKTKIESNRHPHFTKPDFRR